MGCQREIARQILDQGGDYVLALKGNQGTLHEDVEASFQEAMASQFGGLSHDHAEAVNKGHGRIEVRRNWVVDDAEVMGWINSHHQWPGLVAIGMVRAERRIGTEKTEETRYYILSRKLSADQLGQTVRSHWGIENEVHRVLDVAFHEDSSRIRRGYAAENLAVLRRIALNLLRSHPTRSRLSIRGRRLLAGWDRTYLARLFADKMRRPCQATQTS